LRFEEALLAEGSLQTGHVNTLELEPIRPEDVDRVVAEAILRVGKLAGPRQDGRAEPGGPGFASQTLNATPLVWLMFTVRRVPAESSLRISPLVKPRNSRTGPKNAMASSSLLTVIET
jgi:hypothetical protein